MVESIFISISICVVLPVLIVYIVFRFLTFKTQKQTEIMLEAIKNNPDIDTKELVKSFQRRKNERGSVWYNLSRKLLRGCIFTSMGVALIIIACLVPLGNGDDIPGLLIIGCCTACVGIGFLITYWFVYSNRDQFKEDYECNSK